MMSSVEMSLQLVEHTVYRESSSPGFRVHVMVMGVYSLTSLNIRQKTHR